MDTTESSEPILSPEEPTMPQRSTVSEAEMKQLVLAYFKQLTQGLAPFLLLPCVMMYSYLVQYSVSILPTILFYRMWKWKLHTASGQMRYCRWYLMRLR